MEAENLNEPKNPALQQGAVISSAVKKIKLSKAQKQLIQQMRDGNILHYLQGLEARCFFARGNRNESWATIYKLEMLDLIKRVDRFVELTELGKTVQL